MKSTKYIAAYNIKVIDTTGAGDCFCGGLVSALAKGMKIDEACQFACAVGAIGCMSMGATTGIKNYKQILDFIESYK